MAYWFKQEAASVLATGSTCSSTAAGSVVQTTISSLVYGENFTVQIVASTVNTSNIYVDPSSVATTNKFAVHPGETWGPHLVKETLSMVSDSTVQRFYFMILDHA